MTNPRTVLQRFLPPWAPPKPPRARVGDYVLLRGAQATHVFLALVEDRSKDGKRIQVRRWNESRKAWYRKTKWVERSVVVSVIGKVTENVNSDPPTRQDAPG
jgi:hypothetical protein